MIKIKINKIQKNEFLDNGYLILDKFLDPSKVNDISKIFKDLFSGFFETGLEPDEWNWKEGKDPNDVTRQICNGWKSNLSIKAIVTHELLGKACSELMDWSGARLLQDNVLWKPPGGKTLSYHQDAAYDDWIIPQTMVTCWIPLNDVSKKNGTLEFVKKSHKWGLSPPKGQFHSPENYKSELEKFAKNNNKEIDIDYVEVPAGGASFHHGYTWHGSGINSSNTDRKAIVAHCIPSNSIFHPSNVGGTARIYKKYKRLDSDELDESFFPIIWTIEGKRTNV